MLEFTIIKLVAINNTNLFLMSAYATNDDRKLFITELNTLFENLNLHRTNNMYILAGDLNSRRQNWVDRSYNSRGKLERWGSYDAQKYKVNFYTRLDLTYTPADTYLDVCLADTRIKITDSHENKNKTLSYDSDHRAITISIGTPQESIIFSEPNHFRHRYSCKSTKWKRFTKQLDQEFTAVISNNRNLTVQEIDASLLQITSTIIQVISNSVPKLKPKNIVHK